MTSDASAPARDRLLRNALWGGAVAMCAFPKTAPCARALFTVGVIASVGKDVNRLRDEARALRGELAGVRGEINGLRGDVDRRFELVREWMSLSYWAGRTDEREIWEKKADEADLEAPPDTPDDSAPDT